MSLTRKFMMTLACTTVALGAAVIPVLADELLGVLTKVDVEGKTITVVEKDTDREIKFKITDETEQVVKKGHSKFNLEKVERRLEKTKDSGSRGIRVKITHEKSVALKVQFATKADFEDPVPPKKKK
jgi:hypothetical protein